MDKKYRMAFVEVLEIVNYFPKEEYVKIPAEKIEYMEKNKDTDFNFKIDPLKKLSEQNISKEGNAIIVKLYKDYFADTEEVKKINEILVLNNNKDDAIRKKKYKADNLFPKKEEKIIEKQEELSIDVVKKGFIKRFILYVKELLFSRN